MTEDIKTDEAMALLRAMLGNKSSIVVRLTMVEQASGRVFDASSAVLEWLYTLPVEQRPRALFNRLEDALNCARESHQLSSKDFYAVDGRP